MDMSRRHWLGLASSLALAGPALAAPPPGPARIQLLSRGRRDPAALLAAIGDYARAEMTAYGLPGLSLAVIGPDGLSAVLTLGYADLERRLPVGPEQLFQIGSISKSMVALCCYRLAAQGRLDLDGPVEQALPDVPWPSGGIAVRTLLDHSSGLCDFAPLFPRSPDGRHWTNYPPGKRFSYSNLGYDLLGRIVARGAGMPFHRALRELVLAPLGMTASEPLILTRDRARYPVGYTAFADGAFFPDGALAPGPWLDVELPAGSVACPPGDMARYMRYLVALGQGRGAPLLPDALAKRYVTTTIAAPDFQPDGRYAAGIATVAVGGRRLLHHTGGMILYHSSVTVDPQLGGGVFASTNSGAGGYRPRGITHFGCRLLRAFAAGKALPRPPEIVAVRSVKNARDYAGTYVAAGGREITLAASGAALRVASGGVEGRLTQTRDGVFYGDHPGLARHEIAFDKGRRDRLWWGGTLFGRGRAAETPPPPPRLVPLAGLYANDSPWLGSFSLVVRGDTLVQEGLGPLTPAADDSWRSSEAPAERWWFGPTLDGKAERLTYAGHDFRRFHDTED